jgi:radical SAM superfamily enzyme YgiQ (UPF0313 family)
MNKPHSALKDPLATAALSQRSLYLCHGESDFANPGWESASLRALIVRLSPFRDVERSSPHLFLARELRDELPDAYIDFSFLPQSRDLRRLKELGAPLMHGVASARGARDFDLLLISNAYTLELVNLLPLLAESGLPLTRNARARAAAAEGRPYPLLVLGGSNAFASGALHEDARNGGGDSYVDAVYFGEAEGAAGRLAKALSPAASLSGAERERALSAVAADFKGFWPTHEKPSGLGARPIAQAVRSASRADASPRYYPDSPPPVLSGSEASTVRLEITQGCPGFCSFCFEGWERKPYRERPLPAIVAEAKRLKAATGADSLEIGSYNFNTHTEVVKLLHELNSVFYRVNFMSQRADILAGTPGLVDAEFAADKRSYTIGVEGISQRARDYFNKELSRAELLSTVSALAARKPREIKFFYILSGLEDDDDLNAFRGELDAIAGILAAHGAKPSMLFSAGELVRMPFTPLAHERLILEREPYERIAGLMAAELKARGFDFRQPEGFDEYCLSQCLALAPQGSFELLSVLARQGHGYELSLSKGAWDLARRFLKDRGALSPDFLGVKPADYPFPYGFVRTAVNPEFRYKRFLDAIASRERASCLGDESKSGSCLACGACNDDEERAFLTGHGIAGASHSAIEELSKTMAGKKRPFVGFIMASLPRELAFAGPSYAAARLMQSLYARCPELADELWQLEDCLLKSKEGLARLPGAWGRSCYRLLSKGPIRPALLLAAGCEPLQAAPSMALSASAALPEALSLQASVSLAGMGVAAAQALVSDFLNQSQMPHTLSKQEGGALFSIADKGRKRKNILGASFREEGEALRLELSLGSRFDLAPLMASFAKRGAAAELRVRELFMDLS